MNQPPIVQMQRIKKSFGATPVLRGVNFEVRSGQVHALLGGNGAGKSTLMKILMGVHRADTGQIVLDGRDMTTASVVETLQQGVVAMIFQELSLLPNMTVADNIFLGREPLSFGMRVNRKAILSRTEALIAAQGFDIPALAQVEDLSFAQRQQVEILKATARGARVLVMDEPTSSLTAREEERLFELIQRLTASGIGIVYISHRMSEIFRVSDQITVLRDGSAIGPIPTQTATIAAISAHLARPNAVSSPTHAVASPATIDKPLALSVRNLSTKRSLKDISFDVAAGEIVGIAGLVGAGRSTLAKALAGLLPDVTGSVQVGGKAVQLGVAHRVLGQGLGFVPEDRRQEGLVLIHGLADNMVLPNLGRLGRRGALGPILRGSSDHLYSHWAQVLALVARGPRQAASELSGGNQQKVVFAKWLASQPHALILDEPTSGVDVNAKADMRAALTQSARDDGVGILLINSELDELAAVCDRILLMDAGRIIRTLNPRDGEAALLAALLSPEQSVEASK
jgi:ABC-type sugar transport system ATPase subunit